jgi:hypothetical protein
MIKDLLNYKKLMLLYKKIIKYQYKKLKLLIDNILN